MQYIYPIFPQMVLASGRMDSPKRFPNLLSPNLILIPQPNEVALLNFFPLPLLIFSISQYLTTLVSYKLLLNKFICTTFSQSMGLEEFSVVIFGQFFSRTLVNIKMENGNKFVSREYFCTLEISQKCKCYQMSKMPKVKFICVVYIICNLLLTVIASTIPSPPIHYVT